MSKGPPIDSDELRWATRDRVMKPAVPGIIGGTFVGSVCVNCISSDNNVRPLLVGDLREQVARRVDRHWKMWP